MLDLTMDSDDDEALGAIGVDEEMNLSQPDDEEDETIPPKKEHIDVLKNKFGFTKFRPMQWRIISSVLYDKRDNVTVMATGYGKSLCYQFPSVFSGKLTLVVSPLISLMEDQVAALQVQNINATFMGMAQKDKLALQKVIQGGYRLIYMSPEYISANPHVLDRLADQLILVAIDEAHCVSHWGHDFRPSYRLLNIIREALPSVPILALTATATQVVRQDIVKVLKLRTPQYIVSGFDRPNLTFEIYPRFNRDPWNDLEEPLKKASGGSVIIYCISRDETELVVQALTANNINSVAYHAGLSTDRRSEVHQDFVKDRVKIIVATIAFGMGIDKPDVRLVVHYGCSANVESYYQEIGRAGRDGQPARCILFHNRKDFVTHMFLWSSGTHDKERLTKLQKPMKEYVELRTCRRVFILNYFDDPKARELSPRIDCCDICRMMVSGIPQDDFIELTQGKFDFTEDFRKFLEAIKVFNGYSSIGRTLLLLRGSKSHKIIKYQQHHLLGSGRDKSEEWWKLLADLLIKEGHLKTVGKNVGTNVLQITTITEKGDKWLWRRERALLPPLQGMTRFFTRRGQQPVEPLYNLNPCRPIPAAPMIPTPSTSRPQVNIRTVAPKKSLEEELMQKLILERTRIATDLDCMPHAVASKTALEQLCRVKPMTLEALRAANLDGFSEVKVQNFGKHFLRIIKSALGETNGTRRRTMEEILREHPLAAPLLGKPLETYELFSEGRSMAEIATVRGTSETTIADNLKNAIECGKRITKKDLERLGVDSATFEEIEGHLPEDIFTARLNPIKQACDPGISYESIKLVAAYFRVRKHLERIGQPFEDPDDPEATPQGPDLATTSTDSVETIEVDVDLEAFDSIERELFQQAEMMDQEDSKKAKKKPTFAKVDYVSDDSDDEDPRKENQMPGQSNPAVPSPTKKRRQNLIL